LIAKLQEESSAPIKEAAMLQIRTFILERNIKCAV